LTGSCEKRGLRATEAKRKSEGVIAGAAQMWLVRVERMAKGRSSVAGCIYYFSRARDVAAAITSGGSRNHGGHRP